MVIQIPMLIPRDINSPAHMENSEVVFFKETEEAYEPRNGKVSEFDAIA